MIKQKNVGVGRVCCMPACLPSSIQLLKALGGCLARIEKERQEKKKKKRQGTNRRRLMPPVRRIRISLFFSLLFSVDHASM